MAKLLVSVWAEVSTWQFDSSCKFPRSAADTLPNGKGGRFPPWWWDQVLSTYRKEVPIDCRDRVMELNYSGETVVLGREEILIQLFGCSE